MLHLSLLTNLHVCDIQALLRFVPAARWQRVHYYEVAL
jgi:hypothetical protein